MFALLLLREVELVADLLAVLRDNCENTATVGILGVPVTRSDLNCNLLTCVSLKEVILICT